MALSLTKKERRAKNDREEQAAHFAHRRPYDPFACVYYYYYFVRRRQRLATPPAIGPAPDDRETRLPIGP